MDFSCSCVVVLQCVWTWLTQPFAEMRSPDVTTPPSLPSVKERAAFVNHNHLHRCLHLSHPHQFHPQVKASSYYVQQMSRTTSASSNSTSIARYTLKSGYSTS